MKRFFFSRRFVFRKTRTILLVVFGFVLISTLVYAVTHPFAAATPIEAATLRAIPTLTPTPTAVPTSTRTPIPTATPIPVLWLSPALPAEWAARLTVPAGWVTTLDSAGARLRLAVGADHPVAQWVYALVAPFPTVPDGVTEAELRDAWKGQSSGSFAGKPLILTQNTLDVFTARWGAPVPGAVTIVPDAALMDTVCKVAIEPRWDYTIQPVWGIIPFESIEPRCKVLAVDGVSPIRNEFRPEEYALTVPISAAAVSEWDLEQAAALNAPVTNRNPQKFTTLILTGVTAMVRHTAVIMDEQGVLYPGEDVAAVLRAADITHVSNEIAFWADCPKPKKYMGPKDLVFCSNPAYIELMEAVGTDVVELTGNHMNDTLFLGDPTGSAFRSSLEMYRTRGWPFYGGGATPEEARQAILVENHGNRLAFIGCNPVGPDFAWAYGDRAGAAPCDGNPKRSLTADEDVYIGGPCLLDKNSRCVNENSSDYAFMLAEVKRLRAAGYLPIVTFQYREYSYYQPYPHQRAVFSSMVEAGAVVVSGSQSHFTQGFQVADAGNIHFGLGNLFFDEYSLGPNYRESTADRHVFYNGRYLGMEVLTMQFIDAARPRWMTAEERAVFLKKLFVCSGWKENVWEECPTIL